MGAPTRSKVNAWNASPLADVAKETSKITQRIDDDATSMRSTIDALNWSGDARNSADGRSDRENQQMRKVGTAFENLGKACTTGSAQMQPMISDLKTSATSLESDNFEVSDTWAVKDKHNYAEALAACGDDNAARDRVLHLQELRGNDAKNQTVRLQRIATDLGIADDSCAKAIAAANAEITSMTPATAGLSGSTAETDLADVKNGKGTPEELERIHAATQLSDEQKAALADGKPADMSQGQYDYLNRLMRAQDGLSVGDINDLGSNLPDDQRNQLKSDIANGMQVISNPQVHTASVMTPGDPPVTLDKGGMDKLPTQVRTLVTENPVQTWSTNLTAPGDTVFSPQKSRIVEGVNVPRSGDFKSLNDILGAGDKSLAQGSDLDRGVVKQAAEIAGATNDPDKYVGKESDAGYASPVGRTVFWPAVRITATTKRISSRATCSIEPAAITRQSMTR